MSKNNPKVFLVIPTIRNLVFLKEWKDEFANCHLIVVEDNKEKTINPKNLRFASITHYCHSNIEEDFGKNSWIFSRKNAGIRCYGFWKAFRMKADVIITLDDDCYPIEKNFVKQHLANLNFKSTKNWFPTYPHPLWMYTRGFPYSVRNKLPAMISHGLWSGALDLDAKTEVKLKKLLNEKPYPSLRQIIPFGYFYPMCSMNFAFKKEITPLMYFPMMGSDNKGKKWSYNRYDDIWAGIFSKKIMDHLQMSVINGSPFIEHRKASKPSRNLKEESQGMKINESLWNNVNNVELTNNNPKDCYIELSQKINFPKNKYFEKLRQAMIIWANLF